MTHPVSSFAIDVPDTVLARLRRGEMAALEQIYRWFERPVFTLALRLCGDREQAAEVLQDTMLKVYAGAGSFRGRGADGDAPFWGWLRQIAVNEALMALRRQRRFEAEGDDSMLPDTIDERTPPPPAAADAALLQRALAALPVTTRTVLWLYHAEGYTHEQIATLMERTPSFSKSQLARGTRRLRTLLDPPAVDAAAVDAAAVDAAAVDAAAVDAAAVDGAVVDPASPPSSSPATAIAACEVAHA